MIDQEEGLIVAGYGGEEVLKHATFNVRDRNECEKEFQKVAMNNMDNFNNDTEIVDAWENKLCAGPSSKIHGNKVTSTCAGDSGAPLRIQLLSTYVQEKSRTSFFPPVKEQ